MHNLHIRECAYCRRISIRVIGEQAWSQWRRGGYIEEIAANHTIVKHEQECCSECLIKEQVRIALTAGAVH